MSNTRRHFAFFFVAFALVATAAFARNPRIVAVGDIHGEYNGLVSILQSAGVIDAKLKWSGGTTRFVQTGDFTDRGADVRKVMDLLMRLEKEAKKKKGEATILIGNHETMNLTGFVRDVNPLAYAAFADKKSEARRREGYKQYVKLLAERSKRYGKTFTPETEEEWSAKHPLGFIEYQRAFGPDGKYGRWLRSKSAIAQKDGIIFLHGGISPDASARSIKELNEQIGRELVAFDRIKAFLLKENLVLPFATLEDVNKAVELEFTARSARGEAEKQDDLGRVVNVARGINQWTLYHPDGPLWFRGYAYWSDAEGETLAANVLNAFGAKHVVVGHTIPKEPSSILPRFGGKVFLIDTAMLRGYVAGGRPSALEIDNDKFTAIYGNERVVLLDNKRDSRVSRDIRRPRSGDYLLVSSSGAAQHRWLGPRGKPLPFSTYREVEEFLRSAEFVSSDKKRLWGITKPQKVLVRKGRVKAHAVFRSLHREGENTHWEDGNFTEYLLDSYRADLAAYELGMLLGVHNIPPTVSWSLKGEEGALQIFLEKATAGSSSYKPADPVRWQQQLDVMNVFDALIANLDRHAGNMLMDDAGSLWMIDHTRSFGRGRTLHNADQIARCDRSIWERIKTLDRDAVSSRLSPYIGPKEIDALFARRDEVVRILQAKIDAEGETAVLFDLGARAADPQVRRPLTGGVGTGGRSILLASQTLATEPKVKRWIGPNGDPLPFANDEEIVHFLANAKMVKSYDIPEGVTQPRKVLLELNGVQAHAVFRDVKVEKQNIRLDNGKFHLFLRDNYISEVAAYRLGKLLGIDAIPPVVERRLFGRNGSIQLWVEKAMTEGKRKDKGLEPPDERRWRQQMHTILVFDNLVNNIDRNMGNMLIDSEWNVWMIDHTRTFGREKKLPDAKRIARCPRRVWERLTTLDEKTIRETLKPYMGRYEVDGVLHRRNMIIDILKKRIATEGESKVLFGDGDQVEDPDAALRTTTDLRSRGEHPGVRQPAAALGAL